MKRFRSRRFCVYVYRDPRPGKKNTPIYVGKTSKFLDQTKYRRVEGHWRSKTSNPVLQRVLNKIRSLGLTPIIKIVKQFDTELEAYVEESRLIRKYGRTELGTGTLCNLTDGGEGQIGKVISKEQRAAISLRFRSYWAKPGNKEAQRKKLSAFFESNPDQKVVSSKRFSSTMTSYWARPGAKEGLVQKNKERWSDPEYAARVGRSISSALKARAAASREQHK